MMEIRYIYLKSQLKYLFPFKFKLAHNIAQQGVFFCGANFGSQTLHHDFAISCWIWAILGKWTQLISWAMFIESPPLSNTPPSPLTQAPLGCFNSPTLELWSNLPNLNHTITTLTPKSQRFLLLSIVASSNRACPQHGGLKSKHLQRRL